MCSYLISLSLHKHKSAYFRKPSNQLWRHNMAFMLTQHWEELKVCDSLRNRCEEHYKSKEESNLYSKSWPLHDPKTISRKHPFNRQCFYWEIAYLPIYPSTFCTKYYERETAPRLTEKFYFILCVLALSFYVIFLATWTIDFYHWTPEILQVWPCTEVEDYGTHYEVRLPTLFYIWES